MYPTGQQVKIVARPDQLYVYTKWRHNSQVYKLRFSTLVSKINKYKTFSVLIYSYVNTSGNWENRRNCVGSVFTQFRVFPISSSVDITVYQYGKIFLYLFYNIAQRNIKKQIFRRFRVDIELYQHGS